jgi:hypothetical protein
LKAVFSYVSFKRLVSGAFNMGFIGSTCTALPLQMRAHNLRLAVAAYVEIERKR